MTETVREHQIGAVTAALEAALRAAAPPERIDGLQRHLDALHQRQAEQAAELAEAESRAAGYTAELVDLAERLDESETEIHRAAATITAAVSNLHQAAERHRAVVAEGIERLTEAGLPAAVHDQDIDTGASSAGLRIGGRWHGQVDAGEVLGAALCTAAGSTLHHQHPLAVSLAAFGRMLKARRSGQTALALIPPTRKVN